MFDLRVDCATGGTTGGVGVIRSGDVGSEEEEEGGGGGNADVGRAGVGGVAIGAVAMEGGVGVERTGGGGAGIDARDDT